MNRKIIPTSFEVFGFSESILRALSGLGHKVPTLIQSAAIPVALSGRDVMGAAQTGTGKTAGFVLPVLQNLISKANQSVSPARHPIRALILAPTRELALQIYENTCAYAQYTGLKSVVVFGGVDIASQINLLRRGCEILIATPGRLLDHIEQKILSLSQVSILVLDEADRMLDMGFMPDIHRLVELIPAKRQTLLFSATFSKEIRRLAQTLLDNPAIIEVSLPNAAAETVEQRFYAVADAVEKREALVQLLEGFTQVIVFTNTKYGAQRLARDLTRSGLLASEIHGDRSQQDRQEALDDFKSGKCSVLVATDVAARGLDVAELPAVVNYDLPRNPEDYVHRIGRTGRAGASGLALSLITQEDAGLLLDLEKLLGKKLLTEKFLLKPKSSQDNTPYPRRNSLYKSEEKRNDCRSFSEKIGSSLPGYSRDPFFFKPYEEPDSSKIKQEELLGSSDFQTSQKIIGQKKGIRKSAQIAVLLGGKKPRLDKD